MHPDEPTPFFSELDATEGFAPVVTAARPARPVPVPPPASSVRRSRGVVRALLVDVVVVVALGVAMILLAQLARDAVLRSGNVSLVAPHTGVLWTLARASWASLALVAAAVAALYALVFRRATLGSRATGRHAGGIVLPLVVLLVGFALPVGVVAGAAALASRRTVTPPEETPFDVSGDGTTPTVPPETAPPTPSASADASVTAPVSVSRRAPAPATTVSAARGVPATPKQPQLPPTPVPTAAPKATPKPSSSPQGQTGGGQHQNQ